MTAREYEPTDYEVEAARIHVATTPGDSIHESAASAAYAKALEAQDSGAPGSQVAHIMLTYARAWRSLETDVAELAEL